MTQQTTISFTVEVHLIIRWFQPISMLQSTIEKEKSQVKWFCFCMIWSICKWFNFISVYVDMGLSSNNPITLTVVTSGSSFSRSFSIKVTQIDCYSLNKGMYLARPCEKNGPKNHWLDKKKRWFVMNFWISKSQISFVIFFNLCSD